MRCCFLSNLLLFSEKQTQQTNRSTKDVEFFITKFHQIKSRKRINQIRTILFIYIHIFGRYF